MAGTLEVQATWGCRKRRRRTTTVDDNDGRRRQRGTATTTTVEDDKDDDGPRRRRSRRRRSGKTTMRRMVMMTFVVRGASTAQQSQQGSSGAAPRSQKPCGWAPPEAGAHRRQTSAQSLRSPPDRHGRACTRWDRLAHGLSQAAIPPLQFGYIWNSSLLARQARSLRHQERRRRR